MPLFSLIPLLIRALASDATAIVTNLKVAVMPSDFSVMEHPFEAVSGSKTVAPRAFYESFALLGVPSFLGMLKQWSVVVNHDAY